MAELEKLIDQTDYITASILAMEAYDVDHGLCMHTEYDNPLALVSMHRGEDWYTNGRLEQLAERFRIRKVHKHFGCSFLDLLKEPRHVVETILAQSKKGEEEENRRTKTALDSLNEDKVQLQQRAMKP